MSTIEKNDVYISLPLKEKSSFEKRFSTLRRLYDIWRSTPLNKPLTVFGLSVFQISVVVFFHFHFCHSASCLRNIWQDQLTLISRRKKKEKPNRKKKLGSNSWNILKISSALVNTELWIGNCLISTKDSK